MTLLPELEERRQHARHALDTASRDNIVELCRRYLTLLTEYRAELYKLPGTLGVNQRPGSSFREDAADVRKAVRVAVENITRERNTTEALLLSLVAVSGYEAVETLNRQKYKGHDDWELRAGGVARFSHDIVGESMTVLEAVDTASLLRREEHVARGAASVRTSTTPTVSGGSER